MSDAPNIISQGKFRRGTTISVEFPTLPSLSKQPRRVDLHQKQNHHDVLIMEYAIPSPLWAKTIKTGVPVVFKWRQGLHKNEWIGYVSFLSMHTKAGREKVMEVHCVSASYPLKQKINKVFKNKTIPQAVAELLKPYGFTLIADPHARKFDQLVVSGHSIWEWIQEQAKLIGFAVVVEGTTIHFRKLDNLIDTKSTSAPVLSYFAGDLPMNNQALDRTLDSLKVLSGEHIEGQQVSRSNKVVSGVDPISGKVFRSKKTPKLSGHALRETVNDVLFDEYQTGKVVNSRTAANSTAEGAAVIARMTMPAKITGQGDPRIRPFSPVFVTGTGESTDGYWIVKEVHHMFHKIGDYQMEALVATDGVGQNKQTNLRSDPSSVVGKVDLGAALKSKKHSAAIKQGTRLVVKSPILKQGSQGFNKTPARWKSSPIPGRRG
jgi:nucleotide-binding universal stress UspA family protein